MDYFSSLYQALLQQCNEDSAAWLKQSVDKIKSSSDPEQAQQIASAMAKRKVGDEPFHFSNDLADELPGYDHWTCSDAARILLALLLQEQTAMPVTEFLSRVYAQGDERERAALLLGLTLLDKEGLWVTEAEDCCRTNSLVLLSAIGMNNPYPSQYFSERGFNQLVLKSLFLGLNIANIVDLASRLNSQLTQMCVDYIEERVAAGRDYPHAIWLAIRLSECSESTYSYLIDSVISEVTAQRFYALSSLLPQKNILPVEIVKTLQEQKTIEKNDQIRILLNQLV